MAYFGGYLKQGLSIRVRFPGYDEFKKTRKLLSTVVIPNAMDDSSKELCQFIKKESLKILQQHEWRPGRLNSLIEIRKVSSKTSASQSIRKYEIVFKDETVFWQYGVKPHLVKVHEHGIPKLGRNYILYQWLIDHGFDEDVMPSRVKVEIPRLRYIEKITRKAYYLFKEMTAKKIRLRAGEKGIPIA